MRCPECLGGPGACLCHLAVDPAWDRHVAGRKAALLASGMSTVDSPEGPPPLPHAPAASGPRLARVGFVTPALYVGGAERHMLMVARALRETGRYELAGCATWHVGPQAASGPILSEARALMPVEFGPEAIADLYRRSDAAYVWGIPAGCQGWADKPASCKAALVAHGVGDWTARAMADSDRADVVVAVSAASLGTIPYGERRRALVIPNAAELARTRALVPRAEVLRRWGVPEGMRVCGTVARASHEKGILAAPAMMRALEDRGVTGWRFAWVGDGHGMGMLRDAIRAEGVEDLVLTPGFAEDVGSAYGAMDRFVLPSLEEAHPLALVEAMLAGVPAIASAVGWAAEHPDLVRLVPRGPSGEDLASALLADLADPGGSADRAERARSYCLRELSPSRFARAWVAVFDRLTGQATPPDASLLILANACPYADRPFPSCSCGDRKCFRMDRIVGVADCLDCVGHLVNG